MRIIFTALGERQLDGLHTFVSERAGENRADAYISRIVAYCQSFATFPERGTRRDDLLAGLRTIGFERRVTIAFMITPDAVLIEGVFYGGQDLESAFDA